MSLRAAIRNARRATGYHLPSPPGTLGSVETVAQMLARGELLGRDRLGELYVTVENGVVTKLERNLNTHRKEGTTTPPETRPTREE